MIALRDEMHGFIDEMLDDDLTNVIRPLCLRLLYGGKIDQDDDYVIETDLTDEEKELIAQGMREYEEHPESYTSFEDCIKQRNQRAGANQQ
ncbi:hypothetical protein FACS1894184_03860 [Clostridia bacterium]|nr:hypothetical protein FACS1894184_03860 [Clostridia bacterium]